jgi:hypothetical protein
MSKITSIIKTIDQSTLNADQKKYFKLLEEIEERHLFYLNLLKKFNDHILPLSKSNARLCKEAAILLHDKNSNLKVSSKNLSQCRDLIPMLLDKYYEFFPKDEQTTEIYKQWKNEQSLVEEESLNEMMKAFMRTSIKNQFDIDIDEEDFDLNMEDPESMKQFYTKYGDAIEEKKKEQQEKWENRTKTKKESLREAKEKVGKRNIREIYIGLAKQLHPDKARNPEEVERNEIAMKLVTEAYDNNDIIALMNLEFKYLKYSETDILKLESKKIKSFINSLSQQKKILSKSVENVGNDPSFKPIWHYSNVGSTTQSLRLFDHDFAALKNNDDFLRDYNKKLKLISHKTDFKKFVEYLHDQFSDDFEDDFFSDSMFQNNYDDYEVEDQYNTKRKSKKNKKA